MNHRCFNFESLWFVIFIYLIVMKHEHLRSRCVVVTGYKKNLTKRSGRRSFGRKKKSYLF